MSVHLFVSPHLDDVVLSAAGAVAHRLAGGDRVVIASVCTADAPSGTRLSALAEDLHARWGSRPSPYAARRDEDIAACNVLRAEWRHLGLLDAIYRTGTDGREEYQTFSELFDPVPVWDQGFSEKVRGVVAALIEQVSPCIIYAPLCVGGNVDHQHTRRAMLSLDIQIPMRIYEDQPYATGRYPLQHADPVGAAIRASPTEMVEAELIPFDPNVRLEALQCYQSQLEELLGPGRRVLAAMNDYARAIGRARGFPGVAMERVWAPRDPGE